MAGDPIGFELPAEPGDCVKLVVETVVAALDLEGVVDVSEDEDVITATVEGPDLGLLIGRRGQTIDALQLLARQVAFREREERKRVVVDAAGYRARREELIRRRADRAAEDAARFAREVDLEPMGAAERRIVHEHLKDRAGVETYSEGDEPQRYVVVAPTVSADMGSTD